MSGDKITLESITETVTQLEEQMATSNLRMLKAVAMSGVKIYPVTDGITEAWTMFVPFKDYERLEKRTWKQ